MNEKSDNRFTILLGWIECGDCFVVIFKVYDTDCNGKVSFDDILTVLRDLTGQYMSEDQRKVTDNYNSLMLFLLCNFVFLLCFLCMVENL